MTDIKELRARTGLSQAKFADKYHLNIYTLQCWEQGRRTCPESIKALILDVMTLEDKLSPKP